MSQESTNTFIEIDSSAIAEGNRMQTIAHSNGLMFENSISHQKNYFNLNSSNLTTDVMRLLGSKIKKSNVIDRSNIRFLELQNIINQNLE